MKYAVLSSMAIISLLFGLATHAHADQKLPTLEVSIKSNGSDLCKNIQPAIETFLLGLSRYAVPSESHPRDHQLLVECRGRIAVAKWRVVNRRGRASTIATTKSIVAEPRQTPSSFAYIIVKNIMEALPWNGELIRTKAVARERIEFIKTAEGAFYQGELAFGLATDVMLERCLPFEVMVFEGKENGFRRVGFGLVLNLQKSTGAVEFSLENKGTARNRLFYRFLPEAEIPDSLVGAVSFCRWYKDGATERVANDSLDPQEAPVSDGWIELRGVEQKGGFYFGRMETGNGLEVAQSFAASITNRVDFGDWVSVDMRAFRTIKNSVYPERADFETQARKPEGTLAEGYAMIRHELRRFHTAMGAGLLIDKFNVPYSKQQATGEAIPIATGETKAGAAERSMVMRLAGVFKLGYEFQPFSTELRLVRSWSAAGPAAGVEATLNHELTRTWLTGMSLYHLKLRETDTREPGVTYSGIGFHIGISLNRPGR